MVANRSVTPVEQDLELPSPHRWNGKLDPYLYKVNVALEQRGTQLDRVDQPLGLRTFAVDQARGFLLNSQPYSLLGVTRHQDRPGKGWAISESDAEEDHRLIYDMGATAIRLAHYEQSDSFAARCDRSGIVLWEEIPLINRINTLPQFQANAQEQLEDLILQGYNHPSLLFWGLFNELQATWADKPSSPAAPLIARLRDEAHLLDPHRLTVGASWMRTVDPVHGVPDEIGFNIYPGWYWGRPEDFGPEVERLSRQMGGRRIAITEYGAGGDIDRHHEGPFDSPPVTASHDHPEEWLTLLHESVWRQNSRQSPPLGLISMDDV